MSVLVVITAEADAASLTQWGPRFARGEERDLVILIARQGDSREPPSTVSLDEVEPETDPILDRVCAALDQVPVDDARQPEVVVKAGAFLQRLRTVENEITALQPSLLLVGKRVSAKVDRADGALVRRIFQNARCLTLLLRVPEEQREGTGHRILVPLAGGRGATLGLKLVHQCVQRTGGEIVPLYVQSGEGEESQEVGERLLRGMMRKAGIPEDDAQVKPRVVLSNSTSDGIRQIVEEGFDLVLLGASHQGTLRQKLFGTLPERLLKWAGGAAVGVIRGPRPWTERIREWVERWLNLMVPQLERADRVALSESLQVSSRWNFDFFALMSLSTAIAGMGLVLDSTAVVIGAMLVAPLMSPLLGAGLALVQGNLPLLRTSARSIFFGFFTALVIGFLLGLLPGVELTDELAARGGPKQLDLAIAFLSGMAAAYCSARPGLSAALPGVAIAAALVPPIATTGISLALQETGNAQGAALLFGSNVVAIVLGASISLYAGGIRMARGADDKRVWVTYATIGLILAAASLTVVLSTLLLERDAVEISKELRASLRAEVNGWPGAEWKRAAARVDGHRTVLDVELTTTSAVSAAHAQRLAAVCRRSWPAPVLVRLHPEIIVEGHLKQEPGFAAGSSP